MLDKMGKIPQKGESLKMGNVSFLVQNSDQKSIKEVLIVLPHDFEAA